MYETHIAYNRDLDAKLLSSNDSTSQKDKSC